MVWICCVLLCLCYMFSVACCNIFTHILQDCFIGTGAMIALVPMTVTLKDRGKFDPCRTTAKHNQVPIICGQFMGCTVRTSDHLILCGAVIMWSISHKYSQKTSHSSPARARYGVSFVYPTSDWYSASVPVIINVISYNIRLRYNGTRL